MQSVDKLAPVMASFSVKESGAKVTKRTSITVLTRPASPEPFFRD